MKLSNFVEGVEILRKYYDNPDGYHIGAEHDVFYMFSTDRPVSTEDIARLRELGWFQDDEEYEDEDESKPIYDQDNVWKAFV